MMLSSARGAAKAARRAGARKEARRKPPAEARPRRPSESVVGRSSAADTGTGPGAGAGAGAGVAPGRCRGAASPAGEGARAGAGDAWEMKLLFDGECPLCVKEVDMLRRRDEALNAGAGGAGGKIKFVDIAEASYDPREHAGISFETAMGKIHAIERAEGGGERVITGVTVFRRAYECVGLGFVYALTKVPLVNSLADAAYNLWADRRLALTGRGTMDEVMEQRRRRAGEERGLLVDDDAAGDAETCDVVTGRCSGGA